MGLHRLTSLTVGVPDVDEASSFYEEFGLEPLGDARFATVDGGEQLRLVQRDRRGLVCLGVGVETRADIDRLVDRLLAAGHVVDRDDDRLETTEPITGTTVVAEVAPPTRSTPRPLPTPNRPGDTPRVDDRSPVVDRRDPVRPRRLSHVVLGSPDQQASRHFFVDALGFEVSDEIVGVGAFLRCSADHHNLLVQQAPTPYLHHTAWLVDDVDEIGRGASRLLSTDPNRHVWGLGRHWIGSNLFWYLRDPAGNFVEYTADVDRIEHAERWSPVALADERALYAWGPPPPIEFIAPPDLDDLASKAGS